MAVPPIVHFRPPYDFARSIRFWRRSTGELCEHWQHGVYRRVIEYHGKPTVLALRNVGTNTHPELWVTLDGLIADDDALTELEPQIAWLLGDDTDLAMFYRAIANEPALAALTTRLHGIRPTRSPLWETLCWTICGQQISVAFAYVLKERLVNAYGTRYIIDGQPLYAFPTPEILANADPEHLAGMQFSRNKASFIVGLAQAICNRHLDLNHVQRLSTSDAIQYLTDFRGIGQWTAEFLLLRALGRRDAFPAADAGVRQAVTKLYDQKLDPPALRTFSQRWGEWSGLVALYLLASLRTDE
jgi:DNA-3-methyladenine glycosylase II